MYFSSNVFSLLLADMESSNDVALYSGLAAGVVTVVVLVIAVTLYRRNQSEYGVDVIDSSALTGGFQSFSFKSARQGERKQQLQQSACMTHAIITVFARQNYEKTVKNKYNFFPLSIFPIVSYS